MSAFIKTGTGFCTINTENPITPDKQIEESTIIDAILSKINTNIQSAITSIQNHSIINIFNCGEIIGGHRLVYLNEYGLLKYADVNIRDSIEMAIGLTLDAGNKNDSVRVQNCGIITEASWNFEPKKKIYLGITGLLTQQIPNNNVCKEIGFAITKTKIMLRIQKAIFLSE